VSKQVANALSLVLAHPCSALMHTRTQSYSDIPAHVPCTQRNLDHITDSLTLFLGQSRAKGFDYQSLGSPYTVNDPPQTTF
jgi:hypothetical protein